MCVLMCHVVFYRDELHFRMFMYTDVQKRVSLARYIDAKIQSKAKGVEAKVCLIFPSCPDCHARADAGYQASLCTRIGMISVIVFMIMPGQYWTTNRTRAKVCHQSTT